MKAPVKKVVLVSKVEYSEKYEPLLQSLFEEGIEWLFVVGKDCRRWGDAMVFLHVQMTLDDPSPPMIVTTSHPHESIEFIVEHAKMTDTFMSDYSPEVRIIEVKQ
jgi:hypothetical protein